MKSVFEFVSTNVLSGLENVVINICTLVKGFDFTYVSPSGPIDKYLVKYHINHVVINSLTPWNVRKVIKKYHPDIVHGHDVKASLSLALNSHLCHKNHIRIISELHNDDPRMWRYSLRSILYAVSAHCYDKVIVVSEATRSHFIFHKLIDNKCSVIDNVINIYRIVNCVSDIKYTNKLWDCIFLGRLVNQKDPVKFIQVIYALVKKYNNLRAIIVGNGPLYNTIQKYIKKLGLTNNIKMVGFQHNPFKYLIRSKVLLMTSKYEGLSLVALESLFLKIPIISTYTGGLNHIVNDRCGYLANSNEDFVKDVSNLLSNTHLYKEKSLNCRRCFTNVNNISNFLSKYTSVYKSLGM